jgi:hypothetical protein
MFAALGSTSTRISGLTLYGRYTPERIEAEIERFAKRPNIKRQIDEFRAAVENLRTPEDFFKNYKALRFALSAYGMESQIEYPARIRQAMMSDPSDRFSVANRMSDERYRQVMVDFGFFQKGIANLKKPEFIEFIANGFIINEFEKEAGQLNPALTEALYFRRKIGQVQRTQQLYGDLQLFDVVKEALAIPNAAVNASIERLTERIEAGFDVKRVGERDYVEKFIKRYLAMKDMSSALQSGGGGSVGFLA